MASAIWIWVRAGRPTLITSTLAFLIVGYFSAGQHIQPFHLGLAMLTAVVFHFGGYIMNDIVDVELDQADPRRRNRPIASGHLNVITAAVVVMALFIAGAVPLFVSERVISLLGFYLAAVVAAALYNLFGKNFVVPPLMDCVQGLAWASLTLFGGAMAGSLHLSTVVLAASVAVYIAIVNGFQGALRDHRNDSRQAASTTAIFFMGKWSATAQRLPATYIVYGVSLHALQATSLVTGVYIFGLETSSTETDVVLLSVIGLELVATACISLPLAAYSESRVVWVIGFAYIPLVMFGLLSVIWVARGFIAYAITCVVYLSPWVCSRRLRSLMQGSLKWRPR